METALEIKTGRRMSTEHRSQVMIYSLLISERFVGANLSNILLYVMADSTLDGFQYIQ
jgi:hypothetical protein